jgi:hypothetical protein
VRHLSSSILVALTDADAPLSPKAIMAAVGRSDRNAVDQLLHKMVRAGEIARPARGKYSLPGKRADMIRSPGEDDSRPGAVPAPMEAPMSLGKDHDPTNRWSGSGPYRHGGVQSRAHQP